MKIKNALIVYKKSAYEIYFLESKGLHFASARREMKRAHHEHLRTLARVKQVLREEKIKFSAYLRGKITDYRAYDFIISVGGDGTFLEAARHTKNQIILGVNSDPKRSVGRLCTVSRKNFKKALKHILDGKAKIKLLNRIRVIHPRLNKKINALNDVLICHQNPAAMSRYRLAIGGITEDQRGSGIWISTAAGSSGAIRAAGGKILPLESKAIQYIPRELFLGHGAKYRLKGGVVSSRKPVKAYSMMHNGAVYIDGANLSLPFRFTDRVELSISKAPLHFVDFKE